jgi:hypothetical protein
MGILLRGADSSEFAMELAGPSRRRTLEGILATPTGNYAADQAGVDSVDRNWSARSDDRSLKRFWIWDAVFWRL